MRAQRCSSGRCFHGGIAPRPLLIFQKSSPSVSLASFFDVQSAGFGGGSAAAAGPSPLPLGPWHVAQFCSASFLASARSFASPFLAASGFLVFFASAGAFHSPCAQTPETTPLARSSIMPATVSAASGLLVPMTPVGPRLIQPAVYCPTSGCFVCGSSTRPFALRITPQSSLKGTPGTGTPR